VDSKTTHRRAGGRPRLRLDWKILPWRQIATIAVAVGVVAALFHRVIDIDAVHAEADRLPAGVVFALLLILPLFGFPVSLLHVAAGIRFGVALGLAVVALSILLQLLASYAIVRRWRKYFERARWVAKLRRRLPHGAHASVSVFTVLLPGAPYSAINYVLPLLGVPLRTFLLCAFPIHTLRSTVTVTFGDQSDQLTAGRLAVLLVYALLIVGAMWWAYHRLQSRLSGPPPAGGDRKQPA
jgi:uncharacterized membrane protein YdjX (TVP38/TMEM64 family)